MNARSPQPETAENLYDDYDEGFGQQLPPRPRFRFLSPLTAALIALIVGGVGFFVGIRVEKSKVGSTGGASAFASRFAAGGTAGAGATGRGSSRTSGFGAGAGAGAGAGGFASLFGGGGAGAGTTGSVTAVDGDTLYVQESSGNTVKVKLTGSTTVTKSESVSKRKIYPGDEVTITGPAGSSGTVTATAVTDSGTGGSTTGSAGGSSSTGSGSTGATSASSANSSLFGG